MTKSTDFAERERQLSADKLAHEAGELAQELRSLAALTASLADEAAALAAAPEAGAIQERLPAILAKLANAARSDHSGSIDHRVRSARLQGMKTLKAAGASWDAVGKPLGLSRQNAQKLVADASGGADA
ncbi:hypothetical protein [Catellatospora sp. NPDC049133]|uniref:hypothetical protein n=1 Tax=Catellatospora sp. NPDC049133 TaxID=3155499 RepID=UPI0033F0373C